MSERVLIVGAGIAGQTLACALHRRGIAFDIIEKKAGFDIVGAGMYVQNNALRVFEGIGVADEIMAAGWLSPTRASAFADVDGNFIARTVVPPCPGSDLPGYVPIARGRLHQILNDAVATTGTGIRMGVTVTSLHQRDDAVDVEFSDGTSGTYRLVVGADGINSSVRGLTFDGVEAEYSGFSNWRVVLPMDEPLTEVTWQIGPETSFGIIPVSEDRLYVAGVSKEPGNPFFAPDSLLDLMRDRFGMFGGLAGELLAQVPSARDVVYTPIHEIILPRPWAKGRVVLVGDAAHASTPFWAQGASMAVEDVMVLARLLERGGSIDGILQAWQDRRFDRCLFVQEGSKTTGVRGHAAGEGAVERTIDHIRRHAQDDVNRRYERLNQPI